MNLSNEELLLIIENNDEVNLIKASKELVLRKEEGIQDRLLQILKSTQSNIIRNDLALLLSDEKNPKLFEVLVDLLKDSKTLNSRGTLLYALSGYECSIWDIRCRSDCLATIFWRSSKLFMNCIDTSRMYTVASTALPNENTSK